VSGAAQFAYAQARLQARLGESMPPAVQEQLHAARDLASLLTAARSTALRRYAARLAPGLDPHELERHLRAEWVALVDEVARWQPGEWQASIRWLSWLPSLPLLQKLARGGRPPAWARNDPWLGRVIATEPALRAAALAVTPLRPLRAVFETRERDAAAAWLVHWRASWPRKPAAALALERIARDVADCDASLREPAARTSRDTLRALRHRLLRTFRRHPLSPAAAVAFLLLEGLGLLALRGEVMRRAAIEPGPS
jgi:hypothetical protein